MQTGGLVPASAQQLMVTHTTKSTNRNIYTTGYGITGYQVPSGQQTGYTPYGGVAPVLTYTVYWSTVSNSITNNNLPTFAETVGRKQVNMRTSHLSK